MVRTIRRVAVFRLAFRFEHRRPVQNLFDDDPAKSRISGIVANLPSQLVDCITRICEPSKNEVDRKTPLLAVLQPFQERNEILDFVVAGKLVKNLAFPGGRRCTGILWRGGWRTDWASAVRGATGRADSLTQVPPAPRDDVEEFVPEKIAG